MIAISIPFALWGVQAYFSGADSSVAAEVNGETIQSAQLEQMVSQRRQTLRQRFGGELPSAFSDRMLRDQVLEELITREVLRQAADSAGFRVAEAMVAEQIRQQQFFQRDGNFDPELYRQTLSRAGLTPQQYETQVRQGVRLEQMRSGVANTGFVLDTEVRRAVQLRAQERDVVTLERARESVADEVTVAPKAVEAFYEKNRESFRTPHRVRIAYIELDIDTLREQVDVASEDVRAEYEANRQQYRQASERRASHILIEAPEDDAGSDAEEEARRQAERLYQRLRSGEAEFDELAREYSDDAGSADAGGDLGFIARGSMVEPFEQALFALEQPGAITEPVRTRYGYHIIQLEEVREPQPRPFEQVRAEIRKDLATRKAERLFYDRVEVLQNSAYENPGSLEPAADATGVEIRQSDWFSRQNGEGIASSQAIRQTAFSDPVLEERQNSQLVELGDRRVAVLRVVDERPPEAQPLEEVRAAVRDRLKAQRVEQALAEWASSTVEALKAGQTLDELASSAGVTLKEHGWVSQEGSDSLNPRVREAVFNLPPPTAESFAYQAVSTNSGRAVAVVRDVRFPEPGGQVVTETRQQLRERLGQAELEAWISTLKANADIQRNVPDGGPPARGRTSEAG